MEKFKPHVPSERVVKHCEFILSNVDEDIATQFRSYGHGAYLPDSSILMQISRNLKVLSDSMKNNTGK